MFAFEILNKSKIPDYEALVDIDRLPFLKEFNSKNYAGVGTRYKKKEVGIVVGKIINHKNDDRIATIFSFNINPAHQNKEREYGEGADSPFMWDEKEVETINSLGMQHRGEFAGGLVNHRTGPETIHYTSIFITKKYRRLGFAIPLFIESARLQKKAGIPKITWWVQPKAEANLKWYNKLFKPCLTTKVEYRYSTKGLKENEFTTKQTKSTKKRY